MPLPSSGAISFSQIRSEMNSGSSGAISMSSLYANGSLGARGVTGIPGTGTLSFSHFRGKAGNPVPSGLLAKYSGDSWNGTALVDETGSGYNATTTRGTIMSTTVAQNTAMRLIYGGTGAGIQFPSGILPSTYTLFAISCYNGSTQRRILDGITNNWLSGHWNAQTCVAYHEGWVTSSNSPNPVGYSWVLSTDQINLYRGNKVTYGTTGGTQSTQLSINHGLGTITWGETSDWAVSAILVYNRALNSTEYTAVENYLESLYHIPIMNTYNWYTLFTRVNGTFTMVQAGANPDVQLQMSSSSVTNTTNILYYSNRLQDYTSLTIDFGIYVASATGDGASFNIGCTNTSFVGEGPNTPGFSIAFQLYTGGGRSAGIYLYNDAGTQVGFYAVALNNSTWTPVRIIYNRSATSTWQINYNGSSVITYSNPNNETWVTSTSGSYYGFASRTGSATMNFYVNHVSISA